MWNRRVFRRLANFLNSQALRGRRASVVIDIGAYNVISCRNGISLMKSILCDSSLRSFGPGASRSNARINQSY